MNRSTFDIISKYISKANKSVIVFDQEEGACTDMKNGIVHMPKKVSQQNVFAVLALLMHESAHVAHSKEAIEKCVDKGDDIGKHIFNCIEDVRIDGMNFNLLPNIVDFYERLLKDHCDYSKNVDPNIEFQVKILITAMMKLEGFAKYGFHKDKAVWEFLEDNPLEDLILDSTHAIDGKNWRKVRANIEKIKNLLKMAQQQNPNKGGQGGQGQSQGLGDIDKLLHPTSVFSDKGQSLPGASANQIGEVALEEKTAQQFKELLNIKEKKIVGDGTRLDTDNLVAYLTGELEELFKEDTYVKRKKSKILFLLDASGSMCDPLLDSKERFEVVGKCVERMTRILKEVQETEGLNVDWDVYGFENHLYKLDKNTWRATYGPGGGTDLANSFDEALSILEKDNSIDGKKMIIVLTDGEVNERQIQQMKSSIIRHNTNVKALIIGVGCNPTGDMVTKIIGDNIILAEDNANIVIMETIKQLL